MENERKFPTVTNNSFVQEIPLEAFQFEYKEKWLCRELSRYNMLEFVSIKLVRFYDQLFYNHDLEWWSCFAYIMIYIFKDSQY